MGPGNRDEVAPWVLRMLAGVKAGILGGVAMFCWVAAGSLLDSHGVWVVPNLLGSALSGHSVLQRGFGWPTISGLGLHLFVSGLVGACFGLLVGDTRNRVRLVLLGVITGLVWYYCSQILFWRKLGVFIMVYSPPRPMLLSHILYGLVLGRYPSGLRSLRGTFLSQPDRADIYETARSPEAVE